MKNVNKVLSALVIVFVSAIFISMTSMQDPAEPWEIPAKDKSMKNPVTADKASLKAGKTLYTKNCAICHGKMGKGTGEASTERIRGKGHSRQGEDTHHTALPAHV